MNIEITASQGVFLHHLLNAYIVGAKERESIFEKGGMLSSEQVESLRNTVQTNESGRQRDDDDQKGIKFTSGPGDEQDDPLAIMW
jgi:hypothetical protein